MGGREGGREGEGGGGGGGAEQLSHVNYEDSSASQDVTPGDSFFIVLCAFRQ